MRLVLALALAVPAGAEIVPPVQPVRVGMSGPDVDGCPSQGQVRVRGYLSVRSAPHVAAREIARLKPGAMVYLCDVNRAGDWLGVVWDASSEPDDCGQGPATRVKLYDGPCMSGWVSARYVRVVAG